MKYDSADSRYPSGREGRALLWSASGAGPLRHGLARGRTRQQTRELQASGEEPGTAETPAAEEALLSTVLETENGPEIVADYVLNSLVEDQRREEMESREELLKLYGAELEQMEVAFSADVVDDGSSQRLHDPELSTPSPIGQKPSDVEAVPLTYKDVLNSEYKVFWEAAMKKELAGLNKVGTFANIECLPEGRKAVSAKWVFSLKTNEKGLITDFKARMVARGFSQIPG